MKRAPIALISGPPGVGKTAVAEVIARNAQAAHIEEDVLHGMRPGHPRDAEAQNLCVEQILVLCELFRHRDVPILIEGLFFDAAAVSTLDRSLELCSILLLDASLPVCLERNRHRSSGGIELRDNEIRELHALQRPKNWQRVAADSPLEEVASVVRRHLQDAGWPR